MKRKIKLKNPDDLTLYKKIKIPIAGWWFGSKKKVEFCKATIIRLGKIGDNGKYNVIITYCKSKKYGTIGRIMSLNEDCDNFYKLKKK